MDIDDTMLYDEAYGEQMAGSTAVTVIIKDSKLFCANAGDSRAIACINGEVEVLSLDHKPNNFIESKRISEAGGWVEFNRVNGNLALSRALGDFIFKKNSKKKAEEQIVTAYPDVEMREITEDWDFLVLACDGIWDVLSNEEVIQFCRKRIGMGMMPEEICEEIMTHCLAPDCQMGGIGGDNMTIVLVCFLHNRTYEELIAKCASSSLANASSSGGSTSEHSSNSLSLSPNNSNENLNNSSAAAATSAAAVTTTTIIQPVEVKPVEDPGTKQDGARDGLVSEDAEAIDLK